MIKLPIERGVQAPTNEADIHPQKSPCIEGSWQKSKAA
jgi:hypothetical protein